MKRQGLARKAVAAGLGLAMAMGSMAPAVALADSTGNTHLYIESTAEDITTPEGSADENIKVTLPVAINYVADTEGNLTGPSDGSVKIKNNTALGAVHVSKIHVVPETGVTIVGNAGAAKDDDVVYLQMQPGSGYTEGLYGFLDEKAPRKGEWDVAQGGELALNSLTGKIGGFGTLDPSTKEKVATVHWTVAAGTAEQAEANAKRFVIHRVVAGNTMDDLVTTTDGTGTIAAGYTWKTGSGAEVANIAAAVTAAGSGATEITLYGTPNS